MYFVTTFEKLEKDSAGWWEIGIYRTIGYYHDLEDARSRVQNNACDMCEGVYRYVLIQEIEEDCLYPDLLYQELYETFDWVTEDGYYNIDLTYEEINLPSDDEFGYGIVIG